MNDERPAAITWDSTRQEVLALVAWHERREAEATQPVDDDFDWRGDAPEDRRGCYWSKDGQVVACYGSGPRQEDPALAAQRAAGEEDQSEDAWPPFTSDLLAKGHPQG